MAGGVTGRLGKQRECFVGLSRRRQGQAQIDASAFVVGCDLGRRPQRPLGVRPSSLEVVTVADVVPDLRVSGPSLRAFS